MTVAGIVALAVGLDAVAGGLMLCAEGRGLIDDARGRRELAAIARVALNRADDSGRTVAAEIARPGQFALACRRRDVHRFAELFADVAAGRVRAPRWSRSAWSFTTQRAAAKVRKRWKKQLVQMRGTGTRHVFWRRRELPAGRVGGRTIERQQKSRSR